MKTIISLSTCLIMIFFSGRISGQEIPGQNNASISGSITVYCTPELNELTSLWAREYHEINPGMNIHVAAVPDVYAALGKEGNLGLTPHSPAGIDNQPSWKMSVGRDVIIPVINAGNPFLEEVIEKGISNDMLTQMIGLPETQLWGTLVESGKNVPVQLYIINDEFVIEGLKRFLNINQISSGHVSYVDEAGIIAAVQNDPYAIGICKLANIIDPDMHGMAANIRLLPIDKDGNGKIDYRENFYHDLNTFARGVWIGKYPKELSSDIYSVSAEQPSGEAEIAFLNWILTDGQKFLYLSGFSDLVSSERMSKLDKINNINVYVTPVKDISFIPKLAMVILASLLIISLTISLIVRYFRNDKNLTEATPVISRDFFDEKSVAVPKGIHYDRTHTWAFMEKDGTVKIGIDDFLQHVMGPITRVEMKKPGEKIKKGQPLVSIIQNGKQLSLYSPISGTIKEQNKLLDINASVINTSPFADGWVYSIEPTDWLKEVRFLNMAEKYLSWLPEEFSRLKDFLASTLNAERMQYVRVVLQDGGALKENILADFGPEVWEDFQSDFLDTCK